MCGRSTDLSPLLTWRGKENDYLAKRNSSTNISTNLMEKMMHPILLRLSLKLETPNSNISLSASREDISTIPLSSAVELRNPNALTPGPSGSRSSQGHRKSRSLSANFLSCTHPQVDRTMSLPTKSTAPYVQGVRHLLDDSVLEESPCTSSDGSICGKRSGVETEEPTESSSSDQESFWPLNSSLRPSLDSGTASFHQTFTCEGCLRRKTILKDGRKPTVAAWTRYWVGLWDTNLLYFPAKSLRGTDRNAFKTNPSKMTSVVGWMVVLGDNPLQPDAFQLTDPAKGNVYKFRAGSQAQALLWCRHLSEASKKFKSQPPPNLITFD